LAFGDVDAELEPGLEHEVPLIVVALLVWGVVLGSMGALLAGPLTLTVKEVLPVVMGEPPPPLPDS
jgi:predicted PurR-regulated permease PerM